MTENKPAWKSNLAKIDATEPDAAAYAEIPELPDEFFEKAVLHVGGVPVRRGRPLLKAPKQQVTLRLDVDVLESFKTSGPGWQGRINAVLRRAVGF